MKIWNIVIGVVTVFLLAVILGVLVNLKSEVTASKTLGLMNFGEILKLKPKGETPPEILTEHKLRLFDFNRELYSSKTKLNKSDIKKLEDNGYNVSPINIEPTPLSIDKTGNNEELNTYLITLIDKHKVLE